MEQGGSTSRPETARDASYIGNLWAQRSLAGPYQERVGSEASHLSLTDEPGKVADSTASLGIYDDEEETHSQNEEEKRALRVFELVLVLIGVLAIGALGCFSVAITTNYMVIIAAPPQYSTIDNSYGLYQFCFSSESTNSTAETPKWVRECGLLEINCELDCSLFDDVTTCKSYNIVQNCDSFFALRILSSLAYLLVLIPPIVMIVLIAMGYNPKRTAVGTTFAYAIGLVLCILFVVILNLTELKGHRADYDAIDRAMDTHSFGTIKTEDEKQRTDGFPKTGYSYWAMFGCVAFQLTVIGVVALAYTKDWFMYAYDRKRPSIATLQDVVVEAG